MAIAIEKGIPLPDDYRPPPRAETVYPFDQMVVGDSFLVSEGSIGGALREAEILNRTTAKIFVNRKVDKGWRFWRAF